LEGDLLGKRDRQLSIVVHFSAAVLPRPPVDKFDDALRRAGAGQVQKHMGKGIEGVDLAELAA